MAASVISDAQICLSRYEEYLNGVIDEALGAAAGPESRPLSSNVESHIASLNRRIAAIEYENIKLIHTILAVERSVREHHRGLKTQQQQQRRGLDSQQKKDGGGESDIDEEKEEEDLPLFANEEHMAETAIEGLSDEVIRRIARGVPSSSAASASHSSLVRAVCHRSTQTDSFVKLYMPSFERTSPRFMKQLQEAVACSTVLHDEVEQMLQPQSVEKWVAHFSSIKNQLEQRSEGEATLGIFHAVVLRVDHYKTGVLRVTNRAISFIEAHGLFSNAENLASLSAVWLGMSSELPSRTVENAMIPRPSSFPPPSIIGLFDGTLPSTHATCAKYFYNTISIKRSKRYTEDEKVQLANLRQIPQDPFIDVVFFHQEDRAKCLDFVHLLIEHDHSDIFSPLSVPRILEDTRLYKAKEMQYPDGRFPFAPCRGKPTNVIKYPKSMDIRDSAYNVISKMLADEIEFCALHHMHPILYRNMRMRLLEDPEKQYFSLLEVVALQDQLCNGFHLALAVAAVKLFLTRRWCKVLEVIEVLAPVATK